MSQERLVKRFSGWMANRSLSVETQKAYLLEVGVFFRYLMGEGVDVLEVKRMDILDYLAFLAKNKGAKGRNRTMYALRCFYNFLIDYEYIDYNPTEGMKRAKTEKKKLPTYLEEEELTKFINIARSGRYSNRNLLIMALMAYMGLRVGEVVRINLPDIDRRSNVLAVRGKGNTWRYLPIQSSIMELIDLYLTERLEPENEDGNIQPLFVSQFKRRMSRRMMQTLATNGFNELYNHFPEMEGVHLSAHKLRHTFATHQLREGTDISTVQELLGHTDIKTTSIYVHVNKKQLLDAMNRVKVHIGSMDEVASGLESDS